MGREERINRGRRGKTEAEYIQEAEAENREIEAQEAAAQIADHRGKPTVIPREQVEIADYVADFIANRFPQGLPAEWHNMIAEMVLDSFHDGARWAEATKREESRIITGVM